MSLKSEKRHAVMRFGETSFALPEFLSTVRDNMIGIVLRFEQHIAQEARTRSDG